MVKSKGGRPKLDESDQRAEIIQFRMTAGERKLCERAAERDNEKLSAWIRERLLRAAKRETRG